MSNAPIKHIPRLGGTKLIQDYLASSTELKEMVTDFPSLDSIEEVAKNRMMPSEKRQTLFEAINNQYSKSGLETPEFWKQILDENTFTITTGHQLNLFGGPKYFIYKIISIIKLVEELKRSQSELNFIPVFWMASEDHDFEEIDQVKVFGKNIGSGKLQSGPVGRLSADHFKGSLNELKQVLGTSSEANELMQMFEDAFQQNQWSDFTRSWVDQFFDGKVIIVDGDDHRLKTLFLPIAQRELKEQIADQFVTSSNEKLEQLGYHTQVSHRNINLFYIEDGIRERIGLLNGSHKIHNLSRCLTSSDVMQHPECLSPNALLRPVYQETILPNAAYIGGPGELAYWFQLKGLFSELETSFPILVLRDSFLFVREEDVDQLHKMKISLEELQLGEEDLKKKYVERNEVKKVDFANEFETLSQVYNQLDTKISDMHRDYHQMIEAEKARMEKFIKKMELRAYRDAKFKSEVELKRLLTIREKYFPNGGLVERSSSFMEEYILLGKTDYLKSLFETSDTLDSSIKIITVNK